MTNNDKLKQILSALQALDNLTSKMLEADIYPVSFFSQSYDLLQKMQSNFQELEAEQVNLFATKMKEHQALMQNVKTQMQNLENISKDHFPAKSTILIPDSTPTQAQTPESVIHTISQNPSLVQHVSDPIQPEQHKPTFEQSPEKTPVAVAEKLKSLNTVPKFPTTDSLKDKLERKNLKDLRKAFSLNDLFHYRRSLFNDNEKFMDEAITALNNKTSLEDSIFYLENYLHWNIEEPVVVDFINLLKIRFM